MNQLGMQPSFWLILLLTLPISCIQQKPYQQGEVCQETEISLASSQYRGIQAKTGIVFYVQPDNHSLSAYQQDKPLWTTNIITTVGKPIVGEPVIRHLRVEANQLFVTIGKHSLVGVDPTNGQAVLIGAD